MIRTYLIPLLAIAGVVFATLQVVKGSRPQAAQPPVIEPPRAPFDAFVAGSGLVEASSQNIAIGAPVGDIVIALPIVVGADVAKGDVLFELDTRELRARLAEREAAVRVAEQTLARLRAGTRPELIPPARARVAEAQAAHDDAQDQLRKWEQITDPRARSEDEISRRRFAVLMADARLQAAKAEVSLLEAGTWSFEIDVAEAQVAQARAAEQAVRTEIERRIVRSPIDARILQVNIRPGEFAATGTLMTPHVLLGAVRPLHIRVDVDEHDAWRVRAGARARAYARGNKDITTDLTFVRFEPYVVPKRSLTGDSIERVDTRVLQIIFKFEPGDLPLFVGQQVDVFIEAPPLERRRADALTEPSR